MLHNILYMYFHFFVQAAITYNAVFGGSVMPQLIVTSAHAFALFSRNFPTNLVRHDNEDESDGAVLSVVTLE